MSDSGTKRFDALGSLAVMGSLFCWSAGPIFIKYLAGYIDSWTQNFLRYSTAFIFWLPFFFYSLKSGNIDKRIWKIALIPAAANIIMQSLWAASFYYIDPAFMNLLIKSSMLWIAAFSLIFFADERPLAKSMQFWTGLTLSVAGLCGVLFSKEDFAQTKTFIGIVLALSTAFMWAVYTVAVKIAFKRYTSRSSFSVITIYTVAGLGILNLLFGDFSRSFQMGLRQWACLIISGILSIALSHVFYYTAIKRIGATIPSLVLLATPFFVLIASNIVFGEVLSSVQIVFGVVLVGGSALAIWAQGQLKKN